MQAQIRHPALKQEKPRSNYVSSSETVGLRSSETASSNLGVFLSSSIYPVGNPPLGHLHARSPDCVLSPSKNGTILRKSVVDNAPFHRESSLTQREQTSQTFSESVRPGLSSSSRSASRVSSPFRYSFVNNDSFSTSVPNREPPSLVVPQIIVGAHTPAPDSAEAAFLTALSLSHTATGSASIARSAAASRVLNATLSASQSPSPSHLVSSAPLLNESAAPVRLSESNVFVNSVARSSINSYTPGKSRSILKPRTALLDPDASGASLGIMQATAVSQEVAGKVAALTRSLSTPRVHPSVSSTVSSVVSGIGRGHTSQPNTHLDSVSASKSSSAQPYLDNVSSTSTSRKFESSSPLPFNGPPTSTSLNARTQAPLYEPSGSGREKVKSKYVSSELISTTSESFGVSDSNHFAHAAAEPIVTTPSRSVTSRHPSRTSASPPHRTPSTAHISPAKSAAIAAAKSNLAAVAQAVPSLADLVALDVSSMNQLASPHHYSGSRSNSISVPKVIRRSDSLNQESRGSAAIHKGLEGLKNAAFAANSTGHASYTQGLLRQLAILAEANSDLQKQIRADLGPRAVAPSPLSSISSQNSAFSPSKKSSLLSSPYSNLSAVHASSVSAAKVKLLAESIRNHSRIL